MENIVIGIEGMVGAGKTSICRNLIKKIDNSIILHGGNIYRAIVYGMAKTKISADKEIDAFELMKELKIEVKLEDSETVIYIDGKKVEEAELQSKQASINVSKISNIANNKKLYKFGKELIDEYRKKYNIILSSRDIVKMYPNVTYHFFITASLEERTNRKYQQYNKEIPKEEIREMIKQRDELQEETGYYKIYPQTQIIDVTKCNSVEEATAMILDKMEDMENGI